MTRSLRIASVALALVAFGCLRDLPVRAPSLGAARLGIAHTHEDVRVAIDPIYDAARSESYFGVDTSELGLLPILVSIENRGDATSYLVDPATFAVRGADARIVGSSLPVDTDPTKTASDVTTGLMFVPVLGVAAWAASIPLNTVRFQDMWNASVTRQQIAATQLRAQTLSPGETEDGIVFVAFDARSAARGPITLVVQISDFSGRGLPAFELPAAPSETAP